jgi:hypothetical protein
MKEIEKLAIIGGISSLIISIPIMNIRYVLLFALSYMFFIYCPFIFLVNKINTGIVEKIFLLNIAGLSYSMIYVIFDVFFKIPLSKTLFVIITLITYGISYFLSKNIKN